ncbi:MAG: diacylglycerol kinase family protein, partial [Tannerella sp.]|nr:diacylglycerol kinase family protein [Tannerella sp.]
MDNKRFTFSKWLAGFRYAFNGVRILIRYERNVWIHCLIAVCVVIAGFLSEISA